MALAPGGARAKGSSGEHEAIALLNGWALVAGYRLTLERNLEQVRKGGSDINGVPGMDIEVKRVEANGINQWWAQVCRAADKAGTHPFLMYRKNRQPWRFRTRVYAAHYGPMTSGVTPVVADLELPCARNWFQGYLLHQLGPPEK